MKSSEDQTRIIENYLAGGEIDPTEYDEYALHQLEEMLGEEE